MQTNIGSDQLFVRVNGKGAELCSILNKEGIEYLWTGDAEVWPRHAPVLFPVVGKLNENRFFFNNEWFDLGQHGFARDLVFTQVKSDSRSCAFELRSNAQTRTIYPFDFVLGIKYSVTGNVIRCDYQVHNPGESPIFFSIGAHPGFNCPLLENESFEDYYLEFKKEEFVQTKLENGLLAGKEDLYIKNCRLFLTESLFDDDAIVFENAQVKSVSLLSSLSGHGVSIECGGWPYFGIWTKKRTKRFICLEPWFGVADRLGHNGDLRAKPGMIALGKGQEFGCHFTITII